ncbi:hypothetical protein Droror1_Dr00026804 [Drosera rotundifolia]
MEKRGGEEERAVLRAVTEIEGWRVSMRWRRGESSVREVREREQRRGEWGWVYGPAVFSLIWTAGIVLIGESSSFVSMFGLRIVHIALPYIYRAFPVRATSRKSSVQTWPLRDLPDIFFC